MNFNDCRKRLWVLTVLVVALLISATANAGVNPADVRTTTHFSPPLTFGVAADGRIFAGDPFIGREVVEVRITWDVVVADGHDAADIFADVVLPIDTNSGNSVIILDGATLGWSGSGTFNHYEATDRYNGFFGQAGTGFGHQSWGLPFDAVDILPTSRIEIDYVVPEPVKYGGGSGTAEDPYQIWTAEQMNAIGAEPSDWNKHFKLMADIELSIFTGTDLNIIGYGIGTWYHSHNKKPFTGVFDGNGRKISNLNYHSTDVDYIGLFGYVRGEDAEIKDLGLVDTNIDAGTGDYVGSLVGCLAEGAIVGCYVEGGSVVGHDDVGGLAGRGSRLTDCYSRCSVSGYLKVGGLVGSGAMLRSCYSAGMVSGYMYVGGLVGDGADTANCYSTCGVSGSRRVGGLAGEFVGTVANCYSAGKVTGTDPSSSATIGGLVGLHLGYSPAVGSFWDVQTSGQEESDRGVGKTTAEMQDPNTFIDAGWKFLGDPNVGPNYVWGDVPEGGYPILWWQLDPLPALPSFSGGSGEVDDPYLISTAGQLNSIGHHRRLMDGHFKLIGDIDLMGIRFFRIGNKLTPFSGTFDGNGKRIKNFTWEPREEHYDDDGDFVGLFACVEGENAVIKYVGVIDPNIGFAKLESHVGSLVGRLKKASVTDCYVEGGSVSGHSGVGGLIGRNYGIVRRCYSLTRVKGSGVIGGLIGYNDGIVSNCFSVCDVSGSETVGGLMGYNGPWGQICDCHSSGNVSGTYRRVGGLVGRTECLIDEYGDVISEGWIERSYSSADVAGDGEDAGGLVGSNCGTIVNCYATGNITGTRRVGGLVGLHWGESYFPQIDVSYSVGKVQGVTQIGGLVGCNYHGRVWDCFWDIETSGQANMCGSQDGEGGGCTGTKGKTTSEMQVARTFAEGRWNLVNIWGIGENQTYPYLRKYSAADIDQDESVDLGDLAILAENWLAGTAP